MATDHIRTVSLVPADPKAPVEAVAALAEADQIILGPGSLFTSVLAAVAVPDIREGIKRSRAARRSTSATSAPRSPKPRRFDVGMHVEALAAHGVAVDMAVCDTSGIGPRDPPGGGGRHARWPGPTGWPTTRPNWRQSSPICSDDASGASGCPSVDAGLRSSDGATGQRPAVGRSEQ